VAGRRVSVLYRVPASSYINIIITIRHKSSSPELKDYSRSLLSKQMITCHKRCNIETLLLQTSNSNSSIWLEMACSISFGQLCGRIDK